MKRLITGLLAAAGMLLLILDSRTAFSGAMAGVHLCLEVMIPSLFPFLLLSNLITASLWNQDLPILRLLGRLFGIPNGAESILIPGFLGGYPAGALSVAEACRQKRLPTSTAIRLLAFCSNAGPAFLFGMVGRAFTDKWIPWAIWGVQIIGAWTASRLIPSQEPSGVSLVGPADRQRDAMSGAVSAMSGICGWVLFFRVVLAYLDPLLNIVPSGTLKVMITGLIELSNGCCLLSKVESTGWRFLLANLLLSAGGLCITMQTLSVTSGLSLGCYFLGKSIQILTGIMLSLAFLSPSYGLPALLWLLFCLIWGNRKNTVAFSGKTLYNGFTLIRRNRICSFGKK